jgi:hypothetical protein
MNIRKFSPLAALPFLISQHLHQTFEMVPQALKKVLAEVFSTIIGASVWRETALAVRSKLS